MSTRSSVTAAAQAGLLGGQFRTWYAEDGPVTGSITEHEPASMAREQRVAVRTDGRG